MKTLLNTEQARQVLAFLQNNKLSEKEIEVAVLVAHGLSNGEIAEELSVTEKTIKFHLTNIFKKMGTKSRSRLIVSIFSQVLGDNTKEEQAVEISTELNMGNTLPAGSNEVVVNDTNL